VKRILMLTYEFPPIRGGIGRYAARLARAAVEIGHDVTVVAPQPAEDLAAQDRHTYPFGVIRYPGRVYTVIHLLSLLRRTRRWSLTTGHDLIHAVDWPHIMALAFINRFRRIPFAATVYGTEILSVPHSRQARLLAVRNLLEKPDRVFAISSFVRSLLCERYPGIAAESVAVTPLGVSEDMFEPPACQDDIRKIYSIPEDHRILLTVARLDERKGHRTIFGALARLPEGLKRGITYLVVGTGENHRYETELNQLAAGCGVHVVFTGSVSDERLRSLYAQSAVFCMPGERHPTRIEGFGLAYLEAAAHGLPSVASRIGGVPEVVLHDETGLLVEPGDQPAVADALARLFTNDQLCRTLGRKAREYAGTFTWTRCAEKTYGR